MTGTAIERRQFIEALAATAALGCQAARATPGNSPGAADEWGAIRGEFDLSPDWIHLAGFLLASHPRRVRNAIERHRRALDENPALYLEGRFLDSTPMLRPAATYLGAQPEEIALTDSTTMGLAIVYQGLPLASGDEVVTSTHDHYVTHEALRLATLRAGAVLRKVPLYEAPARASAAAMASAIGAAITPRTRVVAITWVHSSTGVRTPVREIAELVARANAGREPARHILLCVDGVHGFGVEDVSMADLGCDFFIAGTHKWMMGPRGTGIVWGKADKWRLLRPTIPHFGAAAFEAWMKNEPPPPTTADMMTPGGFHSFEHRWALGEAFEFHLGIGKAKVARRIHELNRQCKEGLLRLAHVTVHTPLADELSSGIITFDVAGATPAAVVERLHARGIVASTTPYAVSHARLAPSLLNSPEEIDRAVAEIAALA